jgi:uncharacterized membrane protein
MAFCGGCGAQLADGVAFCKQCGRPAAAAATPPAAPASTGPVAAAPAAPQSAAASPTEGLQENVAGALCYLVGWVTGIIFLVIDKRRSVKFHAAQSIVVFGGLSILYWIIASVFATTIYWGRAFGGWAFGFIVFRILEVIFPVAWIFLMWKAYQGQQFRVPVAADIADSLVGKG